jgi:hypothetical protein
LGSPRCGWATVTMFGLLSDIWTTRTRACQCRHDHVGHERYRSGSDCALCDCARDRRAANGAVVATPSKQLSTNAA